MRINSGLEHCGRTLNQITVLAFALNITEKLYHSGGYLVAEKHHEHNAGNRIWYN